MNRAVKKPLEFGCRSLDTLQSRHLAAIKEWRNAQTNVLRQTRPLTDSDQKRWFKSLGADKSQFIFSLFSSSAQAGGFIGYCGITNIDYLNSRGEISFLVAPERAEDEDLYYRDFFAVLYLLSCYGFEDLKLHKLFTETYIFRDHHIKILERFGYCPTGILRDHKRLRGRYWDSVIHSLLDSQWPQVKKGAENGFEK